MEDADINVWGATPSFGGAMIGTIAGCWSVGHWHMKNLRVCRFKIAIYEKHDILGVSDITVR